VVDDGAGMYPEELPLALAPHSTSKIETVTDLQRLATFGFRGEALASMATVAAVQLASRTHDQELGAEIDVAAGSLSKIRELGMPYGTMVTVTNLFSGVPARQKFLKSTTTEYTRCLQEIVKLALAHPKVAFEVEHNHKQIIMLPSQSLFDRAQSILKVPAVLLFAVDQHADHYAVHGFIGAPQLAGKNKHKQFLFVNGRPVTHARTLALIKELYGTLLEPRSFPVFMLTIVVPPEMVDVNVSPKKDIVSFYNEAAITELLSTALNTVFTQQNIRYVSGGAGIDDLLRDKTMEPVTARILKAAVDPWQVADFALKKDTEILQVHNLYLIAQTTHGIVIIDQHAAHERILYEQFLEAFTAQKQQVRGKKVVPAVEISVPTIEYHALKKQQSLLKQMGFLLKFTQEVITVIAVPELFVGRNMAQLLLEFAADIIEDRAIAELDSTSHRTLAFLACRTAIKAGAVLNQTERQRLLEKLFATHSQFTCPHGRPVYIDVHMEDLHKLFKRLA
jgi:DNA mismatch repair protein MutL